ncbi:MAG: YkvA family protein [Pseudomonadota bacterium]
MKQSKIVEILEPGSLEEQSKRETRVREKFWLTLRRAARQIPQIEEFVASYYCALDPKTPGRVRGILLAALAYFVLPLDLFPDFLAMVGFSDDVAVITAAIAAVKSNITDGHREAARQALSDEEEEPVDMPREAEPAQ